jgi:hypothetical protein
MKKLIIFLILCILFPLVNAAYYVTNPVNCPSSDGTNFPGQNCAPQDICGASGSTAQCYDTSIITAPSANSTTSGGGTNYACSDTTCSGGFITDCYATADSGAPFCDNNGAFWCDQNSTCYSTKYRETTCLKDVFASSACAGCLSGRQNCTSNNCDVITGSTNCAVGSNNNIGASCTCACDASAYDCDSSGAGVGNGCEILNGVTCGTNAIYSGCDGASGNCVCSGNYLDCDEGGESVGNGCEILNGGACSIGTLTGVYSGCSGGTGNCIVNPSDFTTGVARNYSTQTVPFLGGWDYGTALLFFLRNNATDSNFTVNKYGCIVFNDSTTQCTAGGSSSGGGGMVFNQNLNTSANVTFNNISVTQNVTANTFLGNINASYILNGFWMTLSSFLLNVTSLNLQNGSQVNTTIRAYNYFNLTNITTLDYRNSTQLNQTYILNNTGNVSFNNVTTKNLNVSATAVLNFTCMYWNTTSSSCQSYIYFNGTDSIWK